MDKYCSITTTLCFCEYLTPLRLKEKITCCHAFHEMIEWSLLDKVNILKKC
jgi:hypothetical protein